MKAQRDKVKELLDQSPMITSAQSAIIGIDSKTLSRMTDDGEINRIARGLYTSADYIPGTYHSFIEACKVIDNGVICLLSAIAFHEIGTQNPSEIWMAIPRRSRKPQMKELPLRITQFTGDSYSKGMEQRTVDGAEIKVYNIPKTIADCFKYRNKIGLSVAIEALKDVIHSNRASIDDIIYYARICRVQEVIRPYMESIV